MIANIPCPSKEVFVASIDDPDPDRLNHSIMVTSYPGKMCWLMNKKKAVLSQKHFLVGHRKGEMYNVHQYSLDLVHVALLQIGRFVWLALKLQLNFF